MKDLPEDLHRLRVILETHRGVRCAISLKVIARILGVHDREQRSLRKAILWLIQELKCPIGSIAQEGGGYFWITNQDELERCLAEYRSRIHHLQARMTDLEVAFGRSLVPLEVL